MLNTECKQCHKKWHHDNAKYCSMCGKKLVEETKFKVGDYVVLNSESESESEKVIVHVERISNFMKGVWDVNGLTYEPVYNTIEDDGYLISHDLVRLATPEEIAEYKAALTFREHGRKPFEVKEGDVLSDRKSRKVFADYQETENELWVKEDFTSGDFTFLKTAEEVNEWLGADDE